MKDDRKTKVTVDEDIMDDECMDYMVVVPVNCVWFDKIYNKELIGLPAEAQNEIVFMLGELTLKSIYGLNDKSYDDIDIAKAYHLLTEEGYTVTLDKDNGE